MQYALKVFEDSKRERFRVVDKDGEPWFVLVDICRELGIRNPSDAAARLDDDEKMTLDLTEGQSGVRGGARRMNIINESGLYSLVVRSDKVEAKRFRKWVTAEVLPAIRKTGVYRARPQTPAFISRYNVNRRNVVPGHFSVLNELVVHLWGRLEHAGHIMADRSPNGVTENRPDISVGLGFSNDLKNNHTNVCDNYSHYEHETPQWTGPVRQYPLSMLPLFLEYLDNIWIPQRAESYLKSRDPKALPYLQMLLPGKGKPMMLKKAS